MVNEPTVQKLREIIKEIEGFGFCGPSDDPDEQTSVLYGFRRLVKIFKRAARGIRNKSLRMEAQNLSEPESLYEAYDIHSDISAMSLDIENYLSASESEQHDLPELNDQLAPLKVFISYSTSNKQIAGKVKEILDDHNIDSFLAHEDIGVSQQWKGRIVEELKICRVFIPLLSREFVRSDWAPQEIGFACSRDNLLIIPLSLDETTPFGFISHIQGKQLTIEEVEHQYVMGPIIDEFPHMIIPGLIQKMANAGSYRSVEALMLALVPYFNKFDNDEVDTFVSSSIENGQIWSARDCQDIYLPQFLKLHQSIIEPEKYKALQHQINGGGWYRP
jgi:hypothetical protein